MKRCLVFVLFVAFFIVSTTLVYAGTKSASATIRFIVTNNVDPNAWLLKHADCKDIEKNHDININAKRLECSYKQHTEQGAFVNVSVEKGQEVTTFNY